MKIKKKHRNKGSMNVLLTIQQYIPSTIQYPLCYGPKAEVDLK